VDRDLVEPPPASIPDPVHDQLGRPLTRRLRNSLAGRVLIDGAVSGSWGRRQHHLSIYLWETPDAETRERVLAEAESFAGPIGRPETYRQAFYARDLAGTVVLVGVPTPEMKLELPLLDVFGRGGALKSSWYGDCLPSRDFPMLIDLYRRGQLDLDAFVSERIPLDGVEEAFSRMQRGEVLRSVVVL